MVSLPIPARTPLVLLSIFSFAFSSCGCSGWDSFLLILGYTHACLMEILFTMVRRFRRNLMAYVHYSSRFWAWPHFISAPISKFACDSLGWQCTHILCFWQPVPNTHHCKEVLGGRKTRGESNKCIGCLQLDLMMMAIDKSSNVRW